MKIKVLGIDETPETCTERVVLKHDKGIREWIRDAYDNVFVLWSNAWGHRGDRVFDKLTKTTVDAPSPFEPELDGNGNETGYSKQKEGLIVIPVDVYEHGVRVWFLRGEAPAGCCCQFDSTCFNPEAPFYLYTDKERWEHLCGKCAWIFDGGEPSKELKDAAYDVARSEVEEMNLCEHGEYYGYITERLSDGIWEEIDSCWGTLTEHPERDVDFPVGTPVVTDVEHLIGNTFEQSCWAFSDNISEKFVRIRGEGYDLTENVLEAAAWGDRSFLERNRKAYENDIPCALNVVDVTERIWSHFPECVDEKPKED